ncbi:MAG: sulfotransferase [Pirellulaceae bacterium]
MQPVVIIGAARSGTNMLRDTLTQLPGVATWPCDEINYIWRHGNAGYPLDEFPAEKASPKIKRYIRGYFDRLARRCNAHWVVEKTCANSLRVPFVDAVLPDAKYIFLVRDGRDVVASAIQRWTASLEPGYILRKAWYVPWSDVPRYAVRYFGHRVYRVFSAENRLASWGPRFRGMTEWQRSRSLPELCAEQWRRSVRLASDALHGIAQDRVVRLQYEEFVADPQTALQHVVTFLEVPCTHQQLGELTSGIRPSSVGNWCRQLEPNVVRNVTAIMARELQEFGYSEKVAGDGQDGRGTEQAA